MNKITGALSQTINQAKDAAANAPTNKLWKGFVWSTPEAINNKPALKTMFKIANVIAMPFHFLGVILSSSLDHSIGTLLRAGKNIIQQLNKNLSNKDSAVEGEELETITEESDTHSQTSDHSTELNDTTSLNPQII